MEMGIVTDADHDAQASCDEEGTATETECFGSPSLHVIEAIADATDADPATMPPLYDTVDPDALDAMLDADATVEIVFEYDGHAIEISGDGDVLVDGQAQSDGDGQ